LIYSYSPGLPSPFPLLVSHFCSIGRCPPLLSIFNELMWTQLLFIGPFPRPRQTSCFSICPDSLPIRMIHFWVYVSRPWKHNKEVEHFRKKIGQQQRVIIHIQPSLSIITLLTLFP